jgi:hypothetical protein
MSWSGRRYGDRLTFLAGIDVQHTLRKNSEAWEVRFLIDTFDRAEGACA